MLIQKTTLACLLFLLIFSSSSGQEKALESIGVESMREHLSYLASDRLQGRRLGTPVDGLNMAADYLKYHAEEIGLKPAVPGYFQEFELYSWGTDPASVIEVAGSKGRVGYKTRDFVRIDGGHNDILLENMPVVFAGFGENEPEAELSGKVVVLAQGDAKSMDTRRSSAWNRRAENRKTRSMIDRRPEAVIVIAGLNDPHQRLINDMKAFFKRPRYSLPNDTERERTPIIVASPELADKLLGGKNKYKKYLESYVEGNTGGGLEPEKSRLNIRLKAHKGVAEVKNVVATIEGSDPKLKDECVVFMAHYDHLGMDENGKVFNGADDNASGTVAIMEVAKAFSMLPEKPRRRIVFLWVTAEELGLLGSEYYVENPVFPLEKTVTAFNLDMVGRVYESRDSVWKDSPKLVRDFEGLFTLTNTTWPELAMICTENCEKLGLVADTSLPDVFLGSSDHFSFHKHGVPILNLATGYHADYHQVSDTVDKINFEKMKLVAKLCVLIGLEVANRDEIHINPTRP